MKTYDQVMSEALTSKLEQSKRNHSFAQADATVLYSAAKQALDFIDQGLELGFIQISNAAREEQVKLLRTRLELALELSPQGLGGE